MKKIISILVILVLVGWVLILGNKDSITSDGKTLIGAILPMTGPSAVYGEQIKIGMEYALKEFDTDGLFVLNVQDSQSSASVGLSAYNKLLNDGTDVFVSAFSRVSIPLKELALKDKKPLVMTLVSAMSAVNDQNPYVFRIFHNAETAVNSYIKIIDAKGFKKIGVVYVNDEYGVSVNDTLSKKLKEKGIISTSEAYSPEQVDYRTQIQKLKSAQPDLIVFVGIPPVSLQSFLKQKSELDFNTPVIDGAGILPGAGALKLFGSSAENIYTFATLFDLGKTGQNISEELKSKNIDRTYAVAYGYDVIKYIIAAKKYSDENDVSISKAMSSIETFEGIASPYTLLGKNKEDIQPEVVPVQVKNGSFVEVK